jgi:hypothetical protein
MVRRVLQCMVRRVLLLAGFLLVGWASPSWTAESPSNLPPPASLSGNLKRGPQGDVEIVNPTRIEGTAPRICSANSICVGPGQSYSTLTAALKAARDGDVVEVVAGTYRETVKLERRNLTVRGIKGRPHIDCAGLRPMEDKACLLITADGVALENLEISGAEISEGLGANAACVRNGQNASFTLRRIFCHGSQDGVLSAGGTIVIEASEFSDNGWTGLTHNVYFGDCASVTVRGSTFAGARVGHEFKSRCAETRISGSTFRSTKGSRDLDLPDGGKTIVEQSTLIKTAEAESEQIVGFSAESCHYPADMVLRNVKIINSNPGAEIQNFGKCEGHPVILEGVTFEGAPVKLIGNIVTR